MTVKEKLGVRATAMGLWWKGAVHSEDTFLVGITNFNTGFDATEALDFTTDTQITDRWPDISHIYIKETEEVIWQNPYNNNPPNK